MCMTNLLFSQMTYTLKLTINVAGGLKRFKRESLTLSARAG